MKKMNIKKQKYVAFIAVIAILFSGIPALGYAEEGAPSDITEHWAKEEILDWVLNGYINGYLDGTFKPDNEVTRAEFITLTNKAFGYTETEEIEYTDVSEDDWYAEAIEIAKAAGYISGYPDGTMKPNNSITRQEAAVIIMRINDLAENAEAVTFKDAAEIPDWSKGAVGAGVEAGIFTGYPDDTFKPENFILRAESVVALTKAKTYIEDAPIDVVRTVSAITTSGFSIDLNPAVEGLTVEDITLTEGENAITISAIETENEGATYTVSAILEENKTYAFNFTKEGYNFGDASEFVVLPAENFVINLISALPEADSLTLDDADAVNSAKEAFDALSAEEQAMVSAEHQTKLSDVVTKLGELEQADADAAQANNVSEIIMALPVAEDLTLEDVDAVNEAKTAFDALTEAQKEFVSEDARNKLNDAISKIEVLQADTNQE